jgi:hypothetical protein
LNKENLEIIEKKSPVNLPPNDKHMDMFVLPSYFYINTYFPRFVIKVSKVLHILPNFPPERLNLYKPFSVSSINLKKKKTLNLRVEKYHIAILVLFYISHSSSWPFWPYACG